MQKLTKIVATIGPATESEEIIEQLIKAGMNVARFNTKHGTPEWHAEIMQRVRNIAEKLNTSVGLLLDLQGPEVRITIPGEATIQMTEGQELVFTSNQDSADPNSPLIPQVVIDALNDGNKILIDDGLGEFVVTKKLGGELHARALSKFPVANRKTLNTPGVVIDLPSLIENDIIHLEKAAKNNFDIDYIGLSFVRDAQDIKILKEKLRELGLESAVVAKIENQSAVDHLDEIIDNSEAVMVARGDLAVEVPFQELAYWQKIIIRMSREKGRPVITATQMLKSMVESPRPTRAEVSDVANAIYDGTDAVMLSEETTIGKYPVESVETQATIASFNEQFSEPVALDVIENDSGEYIAHAAVDIIENSLMPDNRLEINKIICLTETGTTARLLSRFRPPLPMHVLTSNTKTYHKLSMIYGVTPYVVSLPEGRLESSDELMQKMRDLGIVVTGDVVLLVHGTFWKKPGLTNTLSLLEID